MKDNKIPFNKDTALRLDELAAAAGGADAYAKRRELFPQEDQDLNEIWSRYQIKRAAITDPRLKLELDEQLSNELADWQLAIRNPANENVVVLPSKYVTCV